ncbi:MAG: hypothetical protein WCK90_03885 [archaeon]
MNSTLKGIERTVEGETGIPASELRRMTLHESRKIFNSKITCEGCEENSIRIPYGGSLIQRVVNYFKGDYVSVLVPKVSP